MFHILSICVDRTKIASFYCDSNNPSTHLTGFVAAYTSDEILINHISKEGYYDGFVLVHSRDLYRIDLDGKYEAKIKNLYNLKKQSHPILSQGESLYVTLLSFAMEQKFVVSVELSDCSLCGFVIDYNDTYVHLSLLDEYGVQDGESCVLCEEIISLAVDTSTEQSVKQLFLHYTEGTRGGQGDGSVVPKPKDDSD